MDERNSSPSAAGRTESAQGAGIADKVRERAAAQLNTQKNRATDGIGSVAQVARETTHHLRERQHETVAGYVEQAADQLERFSQSLKHKDVRELVEDAQRLARRQPALFVGGAFALGLAGARFFKSSPAHERYDYDSSGSRTMYGASSGGGTYRGTAETGEYGRPDWRSPGLDSSGGSTSSSLTAGGTLSGTPSGTTSGAIGGTTSGAGEFDSTSKRSTGGSSRRSRTNTDTERS